MATREKSVDIDVTKLVAALRRRFQTPRELLARLGIDAAMLKSSRGLALDEEVLESARTPNGSPNGQGNAAARLELEALLDDFEPGDLPEGFAERHLKALRKHLPLDSDAAGDEEPHRRAELAELARREQHGGRGGAEALDCESAAEFLRTKGVDEETIKSAVGIVRDAFPPNALPHGGALGRGAGPGAKFAEKKRDAGAMDAAAARLDERFGLGRIIVGDAGLTERGNRRQPPVPSAARLEKTFAKFPGMAAIGVHGGS